MPFVVFTLIPRNVNERRDNNKYNIRPSQCLKAVDLTINDSHKYNWRYDLVIHTEKTDDPVNAFREAAIEFLEELQQTDKSLIIISYKSENYNQGSISKMSKLPKRPSGLKVYFDSLIPKENGGDVYYTSIVLAHHIHFCGTKIVCATT